jgi:S-DNA-T family DNA segregation ATPase FtsK/SpoIIIE
MGKKKSPQHTHDILFVLAIFLGIFILLSIYAHSLMGPFGWAVQFLGGRLFGDALPLFPWVLMATSAALVAHRPEAIQRFSFQAMFFLLFTLTLADSFFVNKMITVHGEISWSLTEQIIWGLEKVFGSVGARLLCLGLSVAFAIPVFQISIAHATTKTLAVFKKDRRRLWTRQVYRTLFYSKKTQSKNIPLHQKNWTLPQLNAEPVPIPTPSKPAEPHPAPTQHPLPDPPVDGNYVTPPLDLLSKPRKSNAKQMEADMQQKSKVLVMALESFNVTATVVNITIGPAVSRFELQPGEGVKISKITNLSQDIALKLAVPTVRIEAPIPGKALIGVEVPNADIAALNLRTIINSTPFLSMNSPLNCVLGQRITGEGVIMNLNKMPHILVAGATGSGKSVCVNAIIVSILMKASPDDVKFLMIDPKKVELSLYSDIPHLLAPVVTNPHKAAATLKQWALVEMERRYELFTEHGVKDLAGYNALADKSPELSRIPYIVVVIDEFADLMMVASQEVENTICRLAQMARATGIHLVIATQRPSVNVVTGLIKANVPSRISFAVQSQVDSRTVLDMAGAEKLLGRGDMLYMPVGASKPDRVQGVFVSEEEVHAVVNFIKRQARPDYDKEILSVEVEENNPELADTGKDELFNEAKTIIQSTQYASTSYLQRKLRIGYNRAARLMDELEEAGVISGANGDTKTRTVLPG